MKTKMHTLLTFMKPKRSTLLTLVAIGAMLTLTGCSPRQQRIREVKKKIALCEKTWQPKVHYLDGPIHMHYQHNFASVQGTCFLDRDNQYILEPLENETRLDYEERLQFLNEGRAEIDKPKIRTILTPEAMKAYIDRKEAEIEYGNDTTEIEAMMNAIKAKNYDKITLPPRVSYDPSNDPIVKWVHDNMNGSSGNTRSKEPKRKSQGGCFTGDRDICLDF